VLRLAMPLTAVCAASMGLRRILVTAFVLAALLVWPASAWLAGILTAPVQREVRGNESKSLDNLHLEKPNRVGCLHGEQVPQENV